MNEQSSVRVTVELSASAPSPLQIPIAISPGTAETGDYSVNGLSNGRVSIPRGSRSGQFILVAKNDSDRDDETVKLEFGALPINTVLGPVSRARVTISDDDLASVEVSYSSDTYTVNEGSSLQVTVRLSAGTPHSLSIPIGVSHGSAESGDYRITGLTTGDLEFTPGLRSQAFTITALHDEDSDDETLQLRFGPLPAGMTAGPVRQARVNISDDDPPLPQQMSVYYRSSEYAVSEGQSISISVGLSPAADREMLIPIRSTSQNTESSDYQFSGLDGNALTFRAGERSATFTFSANQDDDSHNEQVSLGFGPLPTNLVERSQGESTVHIMDDDLLPARTQGEEVNSPPTFTEGESTARSVAEQSAGETLVGLPISAIDPDGDPLTYSLGGYDAAYFGLYTHSGQLYVRGRLDLEIQPTYELVIAVTDGKGGWDSIVVTVALSDIKEVRITSPSTQNVALVRPESGARVETPDGSSEILFPEQSWISPLFVRVESAAVNCQGGWPQGEGQVYLTVGFFDTWGDKLLIGALDEPVTVRLISNSEGPFGKLELLRALTRDWYRVFTYIDAQDESWTELGFRSEVNDSKEVVITVTGLQELTCLALLTFPEVFAANTLGTMVESAPEPTVEPTTTPAPGERSNMYPTPTPEGWLLSQSGGPGTGLLSTSTNSITEASINPGVPRWPLVAIIVGAILLVAAVGWQMYQGLRDRRCRQKSFTRPVKPVVVRMSNL